MELNDNQLWTISRVDCVELVVNKLEEIINKKGYKLPTRATTPMSSDYRTYLSATAKKWMQKISLCFKS